MEIDLFNISSAHWFNSVYIIPVHWLLTWKKSLFSVCFLTSYSILVLPCMYNSSTFTPTLNKSLLQ